jgi:hypothetical protein
MDPTTIAILSIISAVIIGVSVGMYTNSLDGSYLIVYVAGSYWDDTEEGRLANTNKAIDAGIHIYMKCHYAIIPHLGHYVNPRIPMLGYDEVPNDWWYKVDNMIIEKADMLLKISSSRGADAEEKLAFKLGIPVIYSVDEVPNNC